MMWGFTSQGANQHSANAPLNHCAPPSVAGKSFFGADQMHSTAADCCFNSLNVDSRETNAPMRAIWNHLLHNGWLRCNTFDIIDLYFPSILSLTLPNPRPPHTTILEGGTPPPPPLLLSPLLHQQPQRSAAAAAAMIPLGIP